MTKLIDTRKLRYDSISEFGIMEIADEYIYPRRGYETTLKDDVIGMKPLGRIYFHEFKNLNYTDGTPVECAAINGGEFGMIDRYMKAGARVYTDEMVVNLIQSRIYEGNDELKPKLPVEVYDFLNEIANNKAKDKPKRAKELIKKFKVVGEKTDDR